MENSERDGNTRPPDLPLEKFVCTPLHMFLTYSRTRETIVGRDSPSWFSGTSLLHFKDIFAERNFEGWGYVFLQDTEEA